MLLRHPTPLCCVCAHVCVRACVCSYCVHSHMHVYVWACSHHLVGVRIALIGEHSRVEVFFMGSGGRRAGV